jgi:hypothetical protein
LPPAPLPFYAFYSGRHLRLRSLLGIDIRSTWPLDRGA